MVKNENFVLGNVRKTSFVIDVSFAEKVFPDLFSEECQQVLGLNHTEASQNMKFFNTFGENLCEPMNFINSFFVVEEGFFWIAAILGWPGSRVLQTISWLTYFTAKNIKKDFSGVSFRFNFSATSWKWLISCMLQHMWFGICLNKTSSSNPARTFVGSDLSPE